MAPVFLARAARKVHSRAVVKENLTTETDGYGKVRSGTEEGRYAVGDKFSQIKDALPQEEGKVLLFTEKYNSVSKILPKLADIFSRFPNDTVAADGATVLIKNPQPSENKKAPRLGVHCFQMVVGDGLPSLRSRTSLRAVEPDDSTPRCFTSFTASP